MSAVLVFLSALPDVVQITLLGAVGGLIGIGLAQIAGRYSQNAILTLVLICAPVIGVPAAFTGLMLRTGTEATVRNIMHRLEQTPLPAAVLASDPAIAPAFRARLAGMARASRSDEALMTEAAGLMAELAAEQFNTLAPDASEATILAYQEVSLAVLERLAGQPKACVAFILGKPDFDSALLPEEMRGRVERLKARIIQEGAARAAPFRTPLPADEVSQSLTMGYRMTGRDVKSAARFATLDADPAAGCAAAIDYMSALASLEAKRAAKVFKTLLLTRSKP